MKHNSNQFKCPHCQVVAKQGWSDVSKYQKVTQSIYHNSFLNYRNQINSWEQKSIQDFLQNTEKRFPLLDDIFPKEISIAHCHSCYNFSIWVNQEIIYPKQLPIEDANTDMTEDIQALYKEASLIFLDSPKGATALLRLALQKLLEQLGKTGNINKSIKELVEEGLNPKMQQALDFVRVVGNNAVHPGEINLDDNKEIAESLFKIINMIADDLISKPKEMDALYNDIIPEKTRNHIQTRDANS